MDERQKARRHESQNVLLTHHITAHNTTQLITLHIATRQLDCHTCQLIIMATCVLPPVSHPALLAFGLSTPPPTPTSPFSPKTHIRPPVPKSPTLNSDGELSPTPLLPRNAPYAALRQHHIHSLRYVIDSLRYTQVNSGYIHNEDAWWYHERLIGDLIDELHAVEAAQSFNRFGGAVHQSVAYPASHGPHTREHALKEATKLHAEDRANRVSFEKKYPFVQQLFIGPMTRHQAKQHKYLMDDLLKGDLDDLPNLLPPANVNLMNAMESLGPHAPKAWKGDPKPRKTYDELRFDRERDLIFRGLEALNPAQAAAAGLTSFVDKRKYPLVGPLTKEEWRASLKPFGPKTEGEALLVVQREQRHAIIGWLQKPWGEYHADVAGLMEQMGRVAVKALEEYPKGKK